MARESRNISGMKPWQDILCLGQTASKQRCLSPPGVAAAAESQCPVKCGSREVIQPIEEFYLDQILSTTNNLLSVEN